MLKKLICKIFGHKNLVSKIQFINGSKVIFASSNPWNCMRCGECTQKLYFSGLPFERYTKLEPRRKRVKAKR